MYRRKLSIYRVQYYPWYQGSTRGLGTRAPHIRETAMLGTYQVLLFIIVILSVTTNSPEAKQTEA